MWLVDGDDVWQVTQFDAAPLKLSSCASPVTVGSSSPRVELLCRPEVGLTVVVVVSVWHSRQPAVTVPSKGRSQSGVPEAWQPVVMPPEQVLASRGSQALLQEQAANIPEGEMREMFLAIPAHREILQLWQAAQQKDEKQE